MDVLCLCFLWHSNDDGVMTELFDILFWDSTFHLLGKSWRWGTTKGPRFHVKLVLLTCLVLDNSLDM